MRKLDEILQFNKIFVEDKEYLKYKTFKGNNKKLVIVSCMDTRLTELLPKALNIKNGDAKIIKNAGASIMHPFGSTTRSIVVAIYEYNCDEVLVIGHHNCGMSNLNSKELLNKAYKKGITEETIDILINAGIDIEKWLQGFNSVEESIKESVNAIKNHPLVPKDTIVHGLVIDPNTGKLEIAINGYERF